MHGKSKLVVLLLVFALQACGGRFGIVAEWTSTRKTCLDDGTLGLAPVLRTLPSSGEILNTVFGPPDHAEFKKTVVAVERGQTNGQRTSVHRRFCEKTYMRQRWD